MNFLTLAKKASRVFAERFADERGATLLPRLLKDQRSRVGDVQFVGAVYFPDAPLNMYQLDQWLDLMNRLYEDFPVVVVTRNAATAVLLLKSAKVPTLYFRTTDEIEQWLESQQSLRIVFYVNQNILNFQMLRFRRPAHVFISHGESDKDYMASNQLKAYDFTFIAGQAAYDRIARLVHDFDVDERTFRIGRPQVDVVFPGPVFPDDGVVTVLYAPTWEGDRPSMRYSSIASHGVALVRALLAANRFRVVYRPHPRSGVNDAATARANRDIQGLLRDANRAVQRSGATGGVGGHVIDTDSVFGWQLQAADVCVADISAVSFDWLATGKPLVMTRPVSVDAVVEAGSLADRLGMLDVSDVVGVDGVGGVVALIDGLLSDVTGVGATSTERNSTELNSAVAEYYFGDTSTGVSWAKFQRAVRTVVDARSKLLE